MIEFGIVDNTNLKKFLRDMVLHATGHVQTQSLDITNTKNPRIAAGVFCIAGLKNPAISMA
jgi:hypothetical protein